MMSVNWIIGLMLSHLFWPKVILLSGRQRIRNDKKDPVMLFANFTSIFTIAYVNQNEIMNSSFRTTR